VYVGKNDTGLPYEEGTWFAVPLRTNGFGVGIIARMKADEKGGIDIGPCVDKGAMEVVIASNYRAISCNVK